MKCWKDETLLYFQEFLTAHPFSQTFQIIVAVVVVTSLTDYYDVPSVIMATLPMPVLLIISAAAILGGVSWILGLHVIDLFKITSFNVIDRVSITLLCAVPMWFILQSFWGVFRIYKVLICLCGILFYLSIVVLRIYTRSLQRQKIEKRKSNLVDLKDVLRNTFRRFPEMPVLVLENDVDYDLVKRDGIINQLYRSIIHAQPEKSYVISLEGPWGVGKTTIINNTKRILEKNSWRRQSFVIIDDFDPWIYGTQESLLLAMYDTLLRHAGVKYSPYRSHKMLDQLSKIVTEEHIAGNILHSLTINKCNQLHVLQKIKKEISSFLESTDKTFVFFIDNLDRANDTNIVFLFKLIGSVFDLPRMVYVLSFERERIDAIFRTTQELNSRYTEKIIQQEIRVPPINKVELENVYVSCINNLLISYGVPFANVRDYQEIINVILKQAPNLRRFKRLINSVMSLVFCDDNILNKHDLLAIEVIGFFNRDLYEEIHKNSLYFISHDRERKIALEISLHSDDYNSRGKAFFDDLVYRYSEYSELLGVLFPNVRRYLDNTALIPKNQGKDPEREDIAKQSRICSAKYFDLYFSYGSNAYLNIRKNIERILSAINSAEDETAVNTAIWEMIMVPAREDQKEWMERFENYIADIDYTKRMFTAKCLLTNILSVNEAPVLFMLDARRRAELVVAKLLALCTEEEFDEFTKCISGCYQILVPISEVISWLAKDSVESVYDLSMRAQKLRKAYGALCEEVVSKKINLYDPNYYNRGNIWGIYRYYNEIDTTVLTTYISEIMSSRNIYRILWDATSVAYGSEGTCRYHIEDEEFTHLIEDSDKVDTIIKEKPPLTEAERFVYSIYKAYKSGVVDGWGSAGITRDAPIDLIL